jgi:NAD(P)-dependent dehydrogenase (short-subunit alcohol dehydrogenase family)
LKDLTGKVAVVTGGGSGIGSGMASAFAEAGMRVVVADIDSERAQTVAKELNSRTRAVAATVDVTDFESVTSLADRAFEEFGAVHVLCNNAGVMLSGPMLDMSPRDWHWIFAVNVYGVVHGIYAFVPRLIEQGIEAHVVNTASMAAFGSGAFHSAYTASKHAVTVITEALRAEVAESGIGVSGLYPGAVISDIINSQRSRPAAFGEPMPFEFNVDSDRVASWAGNIMEPIEVGRLVRRAVIDNEPWIFTHPRWLGSDRWHEIEAAAARAEHSRSVSADNAGEQA